MFLYLFVSLCKLMNMQISSAHSNLQICDLNENKARFYSTNHQYYNQDNTNHYPSRKTWFILLET